MSFDPLSTVMAWIGAYGLVGIFAMAAAERFVPLIPSYGLFLVVGIGASNGAWSLSAGFLATVIGGGFGCAIWFYAVRGLGAARSGRFLHGTGRIFGLHTDRIERWIASFHRHQTILAFLLQLMPTIRLFAPAFAGLLRAGSRSFLLASVAGIMVWNGLFIGTGYAASRFFDTTNTTVLAMLALGGLLVAEAVLFWIGRRLHPHRKADAAACEI
ncbi:DedA family protein [Rhizobium daejeonense]